VRVKVEVTAEDIASGDPQECSSCPIARAMNRATPGRKWLVDDRFAGYHVCGRITDFPMPDSAREFISRFDRGAAVEPFAFEIDLDAPVQP